MSTNCNTQGVRWRAMATTSPVMVVLSEGYFRLYIGPQQVVQGRAQATPLWACHEFRLYEPHEACDKLQTLLAAGVVVSRSAWAALQSGLAPFLEANPNYQLCYNITTRQWSGLHE